jgi:hypothetical protein
VISLEAITLSFLDQSGSLLNTFSLGPVTNTERNSLTSLLGREVTGVVPAAARSAFINMTMTRFDGAYCDGYADNISLRTLALATGPTVTTSLPVTSDPQTTSISGSTPVVTLTTGPQSTTSPCGVNLFVNPSFELGSFIARSDGANALLVGSSAISGWVTTDAESAWLTLPNSYGRQPQNGQFLIDLSGFRDIPPFAGRSHLYVLVFFFDIFFCCQVSRKQLQLLQALHIILVSFSNVMGLPDLQLVCECLT